MLKAALLVHVNGTNHRALARSMPHYFGQPKSSIKHLNVPRTASYITMRLSFVNRLIIHRVQLMEKPPLSALNNLGRHALLVGSSRRISGLSCKTALRSELWTSIFPL
jgi:hypothetical protein